MLNANEVIMLVLGIGIFFLICAYKSKIKRIYAWRILLSGFYLLISAWLFTVAEDLFISNIMNFLEHFCYAASAVIVTVWCWRSASGIKGEAGK